MYLIFLLNDEGLGHCSRMISYALKLNEKNNKVSFFIPHDRKDFKQLIEFYSFDFFKFTSIKDFKSCFCRFENYSTWVFDTKINISNLIFFLKKKKKKIILIDNSSEIRFQANLNIYPTPLFNVNDLNWDGYTGQILSGWQQVLLRPSIYKWVEKLEKIKKKGVLISFGGSDPNNLTLRVMKNIKFNEQIDLSLIIGPAFKNTDLVKNFNEKINNRFNIIEGCYDITPIIAKSKLLITAIGNTIFEAYTLKTKVFAISNYEKDYEDEKKLNKIKNISALGYYKNIDWDNLNTLIIQNAE